MRSKTRITGLRQRERREVEASLRRTHVIEAAASEFAEKGFDGAQVGAIAARAEVSLATVYALFESKEALFESVIRNTAEAIRDAVRSEVDSVADPRERLLVLVDSLFACFAENQDLLRIFARGTHGLPWRIRQSMGDGAQEIFTSFSGWVRKLTAEATHTGPLEGLDSHALALMLIGSVTTAAAEAAEGTSRRSLDETAGHVRQIFEHLVHGRKRA